MNDIVKQEKLRVIAQDYVTKGMDQLNPIINDTVAEMMKGPFLSPNPEVEAYLKYEFEKAVFKILVDDFNKMITK